MNDLISSIQSNWYELTNIVVEIAFLTAGVWFARNILRSIRASQEQVGALLKLSITGTSGERQQPNVSAKSSLAETSPYWLVPSETGNASAPEAIVESGPSGIVAAWHKLTSWLQTPMSSGRVAPWRRIIRWLQAPAGN